MKKESKIKIFVAHHKPWYIYEDDIYVPIQVWKKNAKVDLWILWDDTGDNISEKNNNYAELTAQYWVWKNYDLRDVDYVWFCHYRRYMTYCYRPNLFNYIFAKNFFAKTEGKNWFLRWQIIAWKEHNCLFRFDPKVLNKNAIDIKHIAKKDFDVYMPKKNVFRISALKKRFFKSAFENQEIMEIFWDFYEKNQLSIECKNLFLKMYPQQKKYIKFIEEEWRTTQWYRRHIFIMKKNMFLEYMEWLFNYLFALEKLIKEKNLDLSQHWSIRGGDSRFIAIMAESLINYRLAYQVDKKDIKVSSKANYITFTDYCL